MGRFEVSWAREGSLLAACVWLGLVGCGGGGASFAGGIGGSGSVHGALEVADSLSVDGVVFDAREASITVNGEIGDLTDLRSGMVATISGDVSFDPARPGVATMVEVETSVVGEISAVGTDGSGRVQFLVAEQSVVVDSGTRLDGLVVSALEPGVRVEVSGYPSPLADDTILARLVLGRPHVDTTTVRGKVRDLRADEQTFWIRKLQVDYSGVDGFSGGTGGAQAVSLREGEAISATFAGPLDVRPAPIASLRKVDSAELGQAGEISVFTGVVAEVSGGKFWLQGATRSRRCRVTPATDYSGGRQVDIRPGALVRVRGVLDEDRRLTVGRMAFP